MPEKSAPEEMKERGEHLHHKEQPAMPEMFGGEKERLKWGATKRTVMSAIGVKKVEDIETAIQGLKSRSLQEMLRRQLLTTEEEMRTPKGRRELLGKNEQLRNMILSGDLTPEEQEIAKKLISRNARFLEPSKEREPSRVESLLEEQLEYTKKASETLGIGVGELKGEQLQELEKDPQKWFRERIERLEAVDLEFESPPNRSVLQEIVAGLVIIREKNPDLEEEFWARYSLHNYSLVFPAGVEAAKEKAGLMTMTHLQRLTRLPGVAAAFQEYERRAKREQEIYKEIKEGKRTDIAPEEKLSTSVGGEVAAIRKGIAEKVKKETGLKDGTPAQRIAEEIWHITGRSAYWDAFTFARDEEGKFEPFAGRGALAGPLWLKRLYNFPAFAELKLKKGYGKLHQYVDLGLRDFWSRSAEKLAVSEKDELEANRGWVRPLEDTDISELQFVQRLAEGDFVRMMTHAGYADETRKLLADSGGFLDQPSWENYTKLLVAFENLGGRKKEKLGEVLEGMIEFNRQRGLLGRSSYSKEHLKWNPWAEQMIYLVIEGLFRGGYISDEKRKNLEGKFGATGAKVAITGRLKAALQAAPGAVLDVIGAALKGSFTSK